MSRKFKIGIYGSAAGSYEAFLPIAVQVGQALGARADTIIVVTGGCTGLPYAAAKAAAGEGAEVWGFAASLNEDELRAEYPNDDLGIYTKLIHVPKTFPLYENALARKKYRNIISTAECDAAIIICGRWGTLNEFTNLADFGKTIGVLTGTGGVADELPALTRKISKEGQGQIIFDNSPQMLVEKLFSILKA